jgi:uncharacterized protein (TIGR00297 family)
MPDREKSEASHSSDPKRWQSRAVLAVTLPLVGAYAVSRLISGVSASVIVFSAAVSGGLALAVTAARAGTLGATLTGALLALALGFTPTPAHSALWPFIVALALTLGASRLGKNRKQAQGTVEHGGRTAAQVAANAGMAALAGCFAARFGALVSHLILTAALVEMTADTLGSELGQLVPGSPRLLFRFQRVPPGTDGAISAGGTLAGFAGGAILSGVCMWAFAMTIEQSLTALVAGVLGFATDSVLGATLERRGLLNNDAVNFLSTVTAAVFALLFAIQTK